jgi:hypothetical protein
MAETGGASMMETRTVLVLLGLALIVSPAFGEDPTPTPTPTPAPGAKSLAEVAEETARNLEQQEGETIVITNKTIDPEYGKELEDGTIKVNPTPMPWQAKPVDGGRKAAEQAKREKWQKLYLEQLALVAGLTGEIADLDSEIPQLQNDFYKWDDPYYRDNVIKPKLDKAMQRRAELKEQLAKEEAAVPKLLDEARRDGAKPGWFRGIKAEPTPSK